MFAQLTCAPGGVDPALIRREVHEWISSPALTGLVEHFGGEARTLAELVEFSRIWDFRGGVATSRHVPGVSFTGIVHPGLMGTAPSAELLARWNAREQA